MEEHSSFYLYPMNQEEEKRMLLLFGNNGQFDLKPYQQELLMKLTQRKR